MYDNPEEGMSTHSSILVLTEEPDRLPPMGLQRVRHDWNNSMHAHDPITTLLIVLDLFFVGFLRLLFPA